MKSVLPVKAGIPDLKHVVIKQSYRLDPGSRLESQRGRLRQDDGLFEPHPNAVQIREIIADCRVAIDSADAGAIADNFGPFLRGLWSIVLFVETWGRPALVVAGAEEPQVACGEAVGTGG